MYPAVDIAAFCFGIADPRPPNFAEIYARGRRGRLEYDHRNLIPPWGHRLFSAKQKSPPWQSALIAIKVHYHHSGQGWWAKVTTAVQDTTGTRQTAYGAFFGIYAAHDEQLQSPAHRTVWHSGLPELGCVPVCSCSGLHFLQTRVSFGPFWVKSRLQPSKTEHFCEYEGGVGWCCRA